LSDSNLINEISKRRTFAIISHPDAGKTASGCEMMAKVRRLLISLIKLLSDKNYSPNMYTSLNAQSLGRQALKKPGILTLNGFDVS
jgi:hypothetical protein